MQITVTSDNTPVTFDGKQLAHVSSARAGAPRWTELTLYRRTDDGHYVLSRVGVSEVYHRVSCSQVRGRLDLDPVDRASADTVDAQPCDTCHPGPVGTAGTVLFERDRSRMRVFADAPTLVRGLHWKVENSAESRLDRFSQELLELAAAVDTTIADAVTERLLAS